jgi:hypothetical protein
MNVGKNGALPGFSGASPKIKTKVGQFGEKVPSVPFSGNQWNKSSVMLPHFTPLIE